jgi:hypothetical protein
MGWRSPASGDRLLVVTGAFLEKLEQGLASSKSQWLRVLVMTSMTG